MCCTLISSLLYPFLNHRGCITTWKLLYARGNREMKPEYSINLYGQQFKEDFDIPMIIASISIIMINKREHCVDNINSRDEDKVNSFPIVRSKHNYGENDRNRT